MKPRVIRTPHSFSRLSLFVLGATTATACLQGHRFDPPKPLKLEPPQLLKPAPSKVEPVKLDNLIAVSLPKLAQPAGETAPASSHPVLATATTADQQAVFVDYVREFEAQRAKAAGVDDTIDYGVALIHLGRHADAIKVLLALESSRPGRYETAANLGTAYELVGNLEEAVVWIARGMERNAGSHQGTEWLHAAILHAKINLREDPHWLKKHGVLDLATGRNAEEIVRAIDFQLGERLNFVPPADAVICDLFYQAAIRIEGPDSAGRRAYYLSESLRFGDWRKAEIENRPKT